MWTSYEMDFDNEELLKPISFAAMRHAWAADPPPRRRAAGPNEALGSVLTKQPPSA